MLPFIKEIQSEKSHYPKGKGGKSFCSGDDKNQAVSHACSDLTFWGKIQEEEAMKLI